MKHTYVERVFNGGRSIILGVGQMLKDPEVRRAYRWVVLALLGLTILLSAGGVYAVFHFIDVAPGASIWAKGAIYALRAVGIFAVSLLSPLFAITVSKLLFPVFSEIPFFAGLRSIDRTRGELLGRQPGRGNTVAIANSLRRFFLFFMISGACFAFGFVPVVGPLIAPPLQLYLAAKTAGWEMLDPYLDRVGLTWSEQKAVVRHYAPEVLGMGLVCMPLLAIPLLGPLLFGLIQAGAARFVTEHLPQGDRREQLLASIK